ncbi:MAG: sugar transferase [Pseudomonadota bacterium]
MFKRLCSAAADTLLLLFATLVALVLRENFQVTSERLSELVPHFCAVAIVGLCVYPLTPASQAIWRFSALPDYRNIAIATAIAVILATAATFVWDRLIHVARSLPILQFVFAVVIQIGARMLFRTWRTYKSKGARGSPHRVVPPSEQTSVLVVGLNRLTEVYLQSVADLAGGQIAVVGLLGTQDRHVGRRVAAIPVLGRPEDLGAVLRDLEPHGTRIDRLVVTCARHQLSASGAAALNDAARNRGVEVQFFDDFVGVVRREPARLPVRSMTEAADAPRFAFESSVSTGLAKQRYWAVKRALDVVLSAALLILLLPVMVMTALVTAVAVGFPVAFWQVRPGMHGRSFKLYKFRTMRPAFDSDGRRLADHERVSAVGNFVRHTRLDELPQLINIVAGHMSFIGPRPLLPRDQDTRDQARLLVRPGLTGWAQVVGGRAVSADDKAALDVWYVKNASLLLDLTIALRTIPMILFGETIDRDKISQAWADLLDAGILARPARDGGTATRLEAPGASPGV